VAILQAEFELRIIAFIISAYSAYFMVELAENDGYNLRMDYGE
jgi:hypothetical protein